MTKNEVTALVAAILSSLHEAQSGCPESTLYILCDTDIHKWNTLRGIMLRAGWLEIKGNYVTLTPKGAEMAVEIDRVMTKAQTEGAAR